MPQPVVHKEFFSIAAYDMRDSVNLRRMPYAKKQRDIYTSPLDALVSVSKQLSLYENQRGMDSETLFDRYQKGLVGDEAISIEWANAYQHYVALHQQLESQLRVAA